MRYEQVYDGKWFKIDGRRMKQMCCGCGLVHTWDMRLNSDGTTSLKLVTDKRATQAARKRYKITITREAK